MLEIDRYALARAAQFQAEVLKHYEVYEFHPVVAKLQVYCSEDLGAFYLDILKDRLYTTAPKSLARRSAQTALWHITHAMLRWMAPFLSFTAEEAWKVFAPGASRRRSSPRPTATFAPWRRRRAAGQVEPHPRDPRHASTRRSRRCAPTGKVGSSLQAEVAITADGGRPALLAHRSATTCVSSPSPRRPAWLPAPNSRSR